MSFLTLPQKIAPPWRRHLWLKCLLLFSVLLLSTGCQRAYHLTVLGTNDHCGHYWRNQQGEYGLAARMTVVNNIRSEVEQNGGYVLLLSAGDINSGPPESTLLNARPDIIGMNLLDYDAMTVGNHEFNQPLDVLQQQADWAEFPFLAANVFHKRNSEAVFAPYVMKKRHGLTVAILGLTTPDTPWQADRQYTEELVFKDPVTEAKKLLPRLRKKADVIIGLTHLGYYPNGQHGRHAPGDVTLARETEGIDYIVGGHTHTPLKQIHQVNDTYISQAGEWGKYISRADFFINHGRITLQDYQLIPVNIKAAAADKDTGNNFIGAPIAEDRMMLTLLAPYREQITKRLDKPVGWLDARFEGKQEQIHHRETSLGNLVADAMRTLTSADLAVINSGDIRGSLSSGAVTLRDILSVLPFGNTIATVALNGVTLKKYLAYIFTMNPAGDGFPQTYGLTAVITPEGLQDLQINGKPVDDSRTYKIAVNNFIAQGGDQYPDLTRLASFMDTGLTVDHALTTLFKSKKQISLADYAIQNKVKQLPESSPSNLSN